MWAVVGESFTASCVLGEEVVEADRMAVCEGIAKETWRFGREMARRRGGLDRELSLVCGRRDEGAVVW